MNSFQKILPVIAILLVVFFAFTSPVTSLATEQINSYNTNLRLNNDGLLYITETIYYDFGDATKHGIYRDIPTSIPDNASNWFMERYIDITQVSVMRDSMPEIFTYEAITGGRRIKIGDPNRTIIGQHVYQIKYVVNGAVVDFTTGEQGLYWNAIGTEWSVPINNISTTLTADAGILSDKNVCYSGTYGSTQTCDILPVVGGYQFSSPTAGVGQGITIEQVIKSENITIHKLERVKQIFVMPTIAIVLILIIGVALYRYKFKYRTVGPVIAQYEPYEGVLPMQAGYIIDGRLDARDITAAIIYLAQKGNIKIERLDKKIFGFDISDYKLTLTNDKTDSLFLNKVIKLLFLNRLIITLSELKVERDSASSRSGVKSSLVMSLNDTMFEKGLYEKNKLLTLPKFAQIIIVLFFPGIIALYFLKIFTLDLILTTNAWIFTFIVIIFFSIGILFQVRRTTKGYEAQRYLKGFKLFLSVTDKDRFTFHNDPRNNPEHFMEYLPYAIAFGVEKQWAQIFAEVSIPQPDWYNSSVGTTFSAVALTQSLDAFSTNFSSSLRAASTPPGSSSYGGGFSGGGGGGGGGGSW